MKLRYKPVGIGNYFLVVSNLRTIPCQPTTREIYSDLYRSSTRAANWRVCLDSDRPPAPTPA